VEIEFEGIKYLIVPHSASWLLFGPRYPTIPSSDPADLSQITEETFENLLRSFRQSSAVDLGGISFIDPYGWSESRIGEVLKTEGRREQCILPASDEVLKYLERMDFLGYAGNNFAIGSSEQPLKFLRSADTDVLLEITPIGKSDDIHFIVSRVKERAGAILVKHLRYDERGVDGFIVALSEVCRT